MKIEKSTKSITPSLTGSYTGKNGSMKEEGRIYIEIKRGIATISYVTSDTKESVHFR